MTGRRYRRRFTGRRSQRQSETRAWRISRPKKPQFRPGRVALFFDACLLAVAIPVSVAAALDYESWLFGVVLAASQLSIWSCVCRSMLAGLYDLPDGDRHELSLLARQSIFTFAAGMAVAVAKFMSEPMPRGVADPLNLALLVIVGVPLVQNAVKARHVFAGAIRLKPRLPQKRAVTGRSGVIRHAAGRRPR